MATVTTSDVIKRASLVLQDTTNVRWKPEEMIDWLNDGQREVVLYKPNACVKNEDFTLVKGAKQTLPDAGIMLVDVPRNKGGDENAIRIVAREILDAQTPNWGSPSRANNTVLHYCFSDSDPKHFYVFPPSPGGNLVEIIYNAAPPNASPVGVISIDDIYASALVDYIIYRAYSKDTSYTGNAGKAANHYNAFLAAIKGKAIAELAMDPNARAKGNPNVI